MKTSRVTLNLSEPKDEGNFRQQVFRNLLDREISVSGKQVVDLGAGPCKFARIAKQFGAKVTAVDARDIRVPKDIEEQEIRFVLADIRGFDLNPFDIVLIFGLLYHLNIDDQVRLLRRCRGKVVLVDTQVCCPDLLVHFPQDEWQYPLVQSKGYEGVRFLEKDNPMASIGNKTSFWHTESSYLKLFADCGFSEVVAYRPFYLAKYGMRSFYRLLPRDEIVRGLENRGRAQEQIVRGLENRVSAQKQIVRGLENRVSAQEQTVQDLYDSTSWKITAPLRGIKLGAKWFLRNLRRTD